MHILLLIPLPVFILKHINSFVVCRVCNKQCFRGAKKHQIYYLNNQSFVYIKRNKFKQRIPTYSSSPSIYLYKRKKIDCFRSLSTIPFYYYEYSLMHKRSEEEDPSNL